MNSCQYSHYNITPLYLYGLWHYLQELSPARLIYPRKGLTEIIRIPLTTPPVLKKQTIINILLIDNTRAAFIPIRLSFRVRS